MDKKGGLGIIIFFCFLLLAVVVILLIIFIHGKDELVSPQYNVSVNKTFFNVTISSNALSNINYVLSNGSWIELNDTNSTLLFVRDKVLFDDGILFPDKVERFVGVVANSTLMVEGFSDEYYYNYSLCNVSMNLKLCSVGLLRKANNFSVLITSSQVIIEPFNGTIQSPMICFIEAGNVVDVLMSLNVTPVPRDLKKVVDFCYDVGKNINTRTTFPIVIKGNEFEMSTKILKVLVRDKEIMQKKNIGDKTEGVLIGFDVNNNPVSVANQ